MAAPYHAKRALRSDRALIIAFAAASLAASVVNVTSSAIDQLGTNEALDYRLALEGSFYGTLFYGMTGALLIVPILAVSSPLRWRLRDSLLVTIFVSSILGVVFGLLVVWALNGKAIHSGLPDSISAVCTQAIAAGVAGATFLATGTRPSAGGD